MRTGSEIHTQAVGLSWLELASSAGRNKALP